MITLGKNSGLIKAVNTKEQEDTIEFVCAQMFKQADLEMFWDEDVLDEIGQIDVNLSESNDESSSSDPTLGTFQMAVTKASEADGLHYVAGYIAKKFVKKIPELGNYTHELQTKNINNYSVPTWIQHLSFGGLIEPSDMWKKEIQNLEVAFINFHTNGNIRRGKSIIKRTANYLKKESNFFEDAVEEFAKQRVFMRIKHLNMINKENQHKRRAASVHERVGSKKMKKITN